MKMFLNTDSSSPYCTHNYLLELGKILRRRAFKLSFQWKKIQLPIYFSLQCNFYLFRPGISCRSRNMGPRIPQCYSDWEQRQLGWASALSWVRWIILNSYIIWLPLLKSSWKSLFRPKRISLEDVSSVLFSSVVDIGTVESLSILWKDSSTMYCFLFQCQQNLNISSVKLSHQLISSSGEKYV